MIARTERVGGLEMATRVGDRPAPIGVPSGIGLTGRGRRARAGRGDLKNECHQMREHQRWHKITTGGPRGRGGSVEGYTQAEIDDVLFPTVSRADAGHIKVSQCPVDEIHDGRE